MEHLLYGAAYYLEYLPYDRLDKDVEMMRAAGINVVRIAESTWSTYEPREGEFDFRTVERVLDAMEAAGISVIVGTPTYAVPAWMVKAHPDILAETKHGPRLYGPRQIMDITHPKYLFYAERIIRKLMEVSARRKCVIGFQLDNETKYYDAAGERVQRRFVAYLREKFGDDLEAMNRALGLDYWSNRVGDWEDFPDVRGTINGSLGAEFDKFRRTLVDEFLAWQAGIVREYAREDQFVTHNLDPGWKGYSYGVQPGANHYHAARALDIAGTDIYHPTQDDLTGAEIAYGGDSARSLKRDNYLVLETEAQGFPQWLPYDGQLRLQAYSHLASGANMVEYWHWHSLHNGCETYWKGVLSHDFKENDTYRAAKVIGNEFSRIGSHLVNLKKRNRVAVLVSNEALTALEWFPIHGNALSYNDVLRSVYDRLYEMNVECDIVWPETEDFSAYDLLVIPALYAAPETLLRRIDEYVKQGGHLFATFKTAFADEYVKVYADEHPHILSRCLGVSYSHFTYPKDVWLTSHTYTCPKNTVMHFMELLEPGTAQVLASYGHCSWKRYAAVTRNRYGDGCATYLGCGVAPGMMREILRDTLETAGIAVGETAFPVIIRRGVNDLGREIAYYLNYSAEYQAAVYQGPASVELLTGERIHSGDEMEIGPWDLKLLESCAPSAGRIVLCSR